jgi:glycerate kinase
VQTPFEDAARVFGPQKGADPDTVERLTQRLHELAQAAPRDPREEPMTGAAGGLAGGLWAHRGARLWPGAAYVLDAVEFEDRLRESAFAVTGEGRLDDQSLDGKICGEVAARCRELGVACHAVVAQNALESPGEETIDLESVSEATTVEELEAAGRRLATSD